MKYKLNMNIINIIQKSIDYEYNSYLKKLNEISLKLEKVLNTINDKQKKINIQNNYDYSGELQKIIKTFKNSINAISKNYEKIELGMMSKLKPKTYKLYESKPFIVNISDTYNMKKTEVISNYIGDVYIKIQR